jgi:hypothetical protein
MEKRAGLFLAFILYGIILGGLVLAACSEIIDEGNDSYKMGACNSSINGLWRDACVSPSEVGEAVCLPDGTCKLDSYSCQGGCAMGACKEADEESASCYGDNDCSIIVGRSCFDDELCDSMRIGQCQNPGTADSKCTYLGFRNINCAPCLNGCSNDECLEELPQLGFFASFRKAILGFFGL